MEFCRFAASSTRHPPFLALRSARSTPLPRIPLTLLSPPGLRSFGQRCSVEPQISGGRLLRAAEIDEVSFFGEKVDAVEEEREVAKGEEGTVIEYEECDEDSLVAAEVLDFLKAIDLKENLDSGNAFPIILYGTGAFIAIWMSVAVVGALDSLPLIPKALEIVGFAYTVWFSYRYLVFKKNRDELAAKIKYLKEEILGPSD